MRKQWILSSIVAYFAAKLQKSIRKFVLNQKEEVTFGLKTRKKYFYGL